MPSEFKHMVGIETQKSTAPPVCGKLANLTRNNSDITFEPSVTNSKDKKGVPKAARSPDVLSQETNQEVSLIKRTTNSDL